MFEEARIARGAPTDAPVSTRSRTRLPAALLALAGAGLLVAPVTAGAAAKTKTVSFTGHYSGVASLLINNGAISIPSVNGKGTGTLLGTSAVLGSGTSSASAQCDPFGGTGSITGGGSKITFTVTKSTSKGCSSGQSGPVTVTFTGTAKATGGTGKAKGATGTLQFKGSLKLADTTGSQNGNYVVTLTGKLTVKA